MRSGKKRIAIITYSNAVNYGSALQTYALNRWIRTQGHIAHTINYSNKGQQKIYRLFEPINSVYSAARNLHSALLFKKLIQHDRAFREFLANNVPMTPIMQNSEQLHTLNEKYDYFVCGSDQIWNVQCPDFDANYMLDFVQDKGKCLAYAPSLGGAAHNPQTFKEIQYYAKDFSAISCREKESSKLITEATGLPCKTVVDPVFLLNADQWEDIIPKRQLKHDYILGYFIGDVNGMRDFALQLSKNTNLPVIVILKNLRDLKYPFKNHYESGPAEFVSLVKNSKYIVTNSFHAVAFSLIFKKDFWVFTPNESSDTRIFNILDTVRLTNRMLNEENCDNKNIQSSIEYTTANMTNLQTFINESKQYLTNNFA